MSAIKDHLERLVDKTAELMVLESINHYTKQRMEDVIWGYLDDIQYDFNEFSYDYLLDVSRERDW